jgi:23S rRNA pseudouridine1911/1915/1917 synthase
MSKVITEKVTKKHEGNRVDLYFMSQQPYFTRTLIKKLIKAELIKINGKTIFPNQRLVENDEVSYELGKVNAFTQEKGNSFKIKPKNHNLEVIYEDENIIVVNKPEGLNSHPVTKHDSNSVLNGIIYYLENQSEFDSNVKVRLVHRLDKDTSGVLLASKNIEAHDFYSDLFENRNIHKEYIAIVHRDFERFLEEEDLELLSITSYIGTDKRDPKKYANTDKKHGKLAKTKIFFEEHFNKFGKKKFSIVKVIPETGRTHQIRVHLSSKGFPILGDRVYGGQKYKRLMLHAHSLTVPLFRSDKEIELIAEVPEKFENL